MLIGFFFANLHFAFRPVCQSDVIALERRLMLTMDMILTKKKRIAVDKRRTKPMNTSSGLWGMISSVTQRPPGSESKYIQSKFLPTSAFNILLVANILDIGQLRLEISALEELSRQLFLEVHSLRNMQERQRWATTLQGKYFNVLGHFFSVYCMWKIFISTINIVFDRVGKKDMVTRGLEIAVHWCGLEMDVAFWSQHVSFILVGCIVVTSIRGLLLTLTKVHF